VKHLVRKLVFVLLVTLGVSAPALAQTPPPVGAPQVQPPQVPPQPPPPAAGSAPVLRALELRFHPDPSPVIEANTYLYYIKSRPGEVSKGMPYVLYDEQVLLDDFQRLWATNFLDNLWIEVLDEPYPNGVIGKHVIFHFEERQRVKIVDYVPAKIVDSAKIEEELRRRGINVRIDAFIDQQTIKRVTTVIRDLYSDKGYQFAEVKPEVKDLPSGPKLVHLTFNVTPGPKVQIRKVDFVGNTAFKDGTLARQMKANRARSWQSFITSAGTYQEAKFEEDADAIVAFYRDRGYIFARVGQPQIEILEDSKDKKTRWVSLKVPVDEGDQYRIGKFEFSGNQKVETVNMRPLYKLKEGDVYSEKKVRKGYEKTKEVYGTGGYMELTALPELDARCFDETALKPEPDCNGGKNPKIVDVTMRITEGAQYFVNRITFIGNTTTHDAVVRRELRLYENGVFDTESLKYSVRRLNQLGYFKPLESNEAIDVQKTPGTDNRVDVKLKFEEQNRNQLSFGAGISQIDGFFGQLGFTTSNFLGRGETVSVNAQKGYRARNYELAITEPFLFSRPITAGLNIFSRQLNYIGEFTQTTTGFTSTLGLPVGPWSRMFLSYSYQRVKVSDVNEAYLNPTVLQNNPYLADSLLLNEGGKRTVSKISPSWVNSTINEPIFPSSGHKYTIGLDLAGLGGNTEYVTTSAEFIQYFKFTPRTSLGLRAQGQYIRPYGDTVQLPIFEKIFIGGEYSIRGFDLRTVGPRNPDTGLVTGGNKNLLFNAEYLVTVAGPVRALLFFDAGQVRDIGEKFGRKEAITRTVQTGGATLPLLYDPFATTGINNPGTPLPTTTKEIIGFRDAWKTSLGGEIRFFMPVLNVPFRLIFAMNPSRGGVFDNNFAPAKRFSFRFAVGTTF
jgi:outer membrane protein insertion porin family